MPPRLIQNSGSKPQLDRIGQRNYGYKYGAGLNLRPNSKQHRDLVDKILQRAALAKEEQNKRKDAWDRTDQILTTYVDMSSKEKALKTREPGKPVKIVVPYSYAAMETILTYMTMAFLNQKPIFQYEAEGPEDVVPVKLLEILVGKQLEYYKGELGLYTWMRDGLAYGIGAAAPLWRKDFGWATVKQAIRAEGLDGNDEMVTQETVEPRAIFEGTDLLSVGPRYLLLDPNVSSHRLQNGEFVGFVEETNQMDLLNLERNQPDTWFNCRYLYEAGTTSSVYTVTEGRAQGDALRPTTLVHMFVSLIPNDWGIKSHNGTGDYPERWLFTVADDWLIIRAEPLDSSHGKYPLVVNAPDFDGYSPYPMARIELIEGLQTALDWFLNSHIANVRKVINNQLVVDPSMVYLEDLKTSKEGGLIRLKPSIWGKNTKDALYQLQVQDVTRGHVADAGAIMDMMQKVSAATDGLMGIARKGGERVSAAEARSTASSAINRLEKLAQLISIMGLRDMGMFFATNTQDYMSREQKLRVMGNWPKELLKEYDPGAQISVDPDQLQIPFDVVVRDGSLPIDTAGVAEVWVQLYGMISQNQVLMQQFDMGRIFLHIARMLGARNAQDFQIQGQVMPNQMVKDQAQKGNLVPAEEI